MSVEGARKGGGGEVYKCWGEITMSVEGARKQGWSVGVGANE